MYLRTGFMKSYERHIIQNEYLAFDKPALTLAAHICRSSPMKQELVYLKKASGLIPLAFCSL